MVLSRHCSNNCGHLVTSRNISTHPNTRSKRKALYHTNLSFNWMAYVRLKFKLNFKLFYSQLFFDLALISRNTHASLNCKIARGANVRKGAVHMNESREIFKFFCKMKKIKKIDEFVHERNNDDNFLFSCLI